MNTEKETPSTVALSGTLTFTAIPELLGRTFAKVFTARVRGDDALIFEDAEGQRVFLVHIQECCEDVNLADVAGDLSDLQGAPLLMAEVAEHVPTLENSYDSETWSFYKFATRYGYLTVRFDGSSNGYYGETVDVLDEKNPADSWRIDRLMRNDVQPFTFEASR